MADLNAELCAIIGETMIALQKISDSLKLVDDESEVNLVLPDCFGNAGPIQEDQNEGIESPDDGDSTYEE